MTVRSSDEMLRGQLERMLNQSGVNVTPELFADSGMFTIVSHLGDEWIISVTTYRMRIVLNKGIYTVTII